jgi:hypothetical protein
MKLWIDDIRPAPEGYEWIKSVNEAKRKIIEIEKQINFIEKKANDAFKNYHRIQALQIRKLAKRREIMVIDIDHDAGDYVDDGGDYIKLLDWLEETGRNYPIHIHSKNPVGVENMRRIIERNGWKEIR